MRTARILLGALLVLALTSSLGAVPAQAAKKPIVVWVDENTRAATKALFAEGINGRAVRVKARDMSTLAEQLRTVSVEEAPDIVLIDNEVIAHGRRPFSGERAIDVAMA